MLALGWLARDYFKSLKVQIADGAATRKVLEDLTVAINRMAVGIEERAKMTGALLENQQLMLDAMNTLNRAMLRLDDRQERSDTDSAKALRTLGDINHHLANLRTMVAGRLE